MRKTLSAKKIICLVMLVTILMTNTTVFGVWWATPGYEWALTNRLTSVKSTSQLNRNVSLSDFYTTVLRYLYLKGISPRAETIHHYDEMDGVDTVARGIFEIINGYTSMEALTIQQYYIVENYVEHAKVTLEKYKDYSSYITTENLKNIYLYLDLSQYKAATLISSRSDREFILNQLGYIKNSGIVYYNVLPYAGEITRREFLLVMYDLISTNEDLSEDDIIKAYYNAGVLIGFDTGLELDKRITYSEMLTFLYRFEIFDFESDPTKEAKK